MLVRDCSGWPRLGGCLRVTIGTPTENDRFLRALGEVLAMTRSATRSRTTKETSVEIAIDLDGTGRTECSTGIPFYDHMLDQLGRHGGFDLTVKATGDLHIDTHHTVEDVAIALGEAFREALGDKAGIRRFASGQFPLDEALIEVALDISGRPFVAWDVPLPESLPLGDPAFDPQLAEHAVSSFATNAGLTLHVTMKSGRNVHHIIEATFKGLARSLPRRRARRRQRRGPVDEGRPVTERPLVAVLDYGIGNLHSAHKALVRQGADAHLTGDRGLIADAVAVVLPGVGAFGACMEALRDERSGGSGAGRGRVGAAVPRRVRRDADAVRRQRGGPRRARARRAAGHRAMDPARREAAADAVEPGRRHEARPTVRRAR